MNPLLKSWKRVLILGLLWSPLCFVVIALHSSITTTPFELSALFLLPFLIIELFLCLSLWWVCKNFPIYKIRLIDAILIIVLSSSVIIAFWLFLFFLYSEFLEKVMKNIKWDLIFIQSLPLLIAIGLFFYLLACFFCFFYFFIIAMEKSQEAERNALEQKLRAAETELKALKSTINPHFLFNSLTALNELIKDSPNVASRMCISIADFLRYTVRYSEEDLVSINGELKHIRNYLDIEKIRLGDRLRVDIRGERATGGLRIPPLILLPLVENAVKHGISQIIEGGKIDIRLKKLGARRLEIDVKNPRDDNSKKLYGEGRGIETLRRRIAAYYGTDASLIITKDDKTYEARIILPAL